MYVCMCIYIYTYTCIYLYIRIHTYTHIHMYTLSILCYVMLCYIICVAHYLCCLYDVRLLLSWCYYLAAFQSRMILCREPKRALTRRASKRRVPMGRWVYIYIYIHIIIHVYIYIYNIAPSTEMHVGSGQGCLLVGARARQRMFGSI